MNKLQKNRSIPGGRWPWLSLAALLCLGIGIGIGLSLREKQVFDVIVEGGKVFDGDKWMPSGTNIGIKGGKVVALGRLLGARAVQRIDAHGRIVSPGFIDTHVHIEASMGSRSPLRAPNFVRMGATTLITGNCGNSLEELPAVLDGLNKHGGQVNVATLVGHKHLRKVVMKGEGKGDPTLNQILEMQHLLDREMRAGALGFSTGLEYSPGLMAKPSEVAELAKVVARWDGIYATHIRNEGINLKKSLEEAIQTAQQAKVHLHISHIKIACQRDWGKMPEILSLLNQARGSLPGLTQDAYGYAASSSGLDLILPEKFRGFQGSRRDLVRNREQCRELAQGMVDLLRELGFPDYSFAQIVWSRNPSWRGLRLSEVPETAFPNAPPEEWLTAIAPDSVLRQQLRTTLGFFSEGGGQMIFHVMSEDDIATALSDPHCVVGCDSSVRGDDSVTAHPRGCGNFPRILGAFVREKKTITLEQALHKITRQSAEIFHLHDRGRLALGLPADLVVFDSSRIADKATYTSPLEVPEGIDYVLVNGVVVLDHERIYNRFPGKVLRHQVKDPGPWNPPSTSASPQEKDAVESAPAQGAATGEKGTSSKQESRKKKKVRSSRSKKSHSPTKH